jgi:hypothetical protein
MKYKQVVKADFVAGESFELVDYMDDVDGVNEMDNEEMSECCPFRSLRPQT